MKRLIILSAAVMALSAAASAQTVYASNSTRSDKQEERSISKDKEAIRNERVNELTQDAFAADFSDVKDVSWKSSKRFDEATFKQNGVEMTAYYDMNSQLVGTTCLKKFSALPVKAQEYIDKKYGNYVKGEVVLFDDNETNPTDMLMYNTMLVDRDTYFIELTKGNKNIVLQVFPDGEVLYFTAL